MAQREFPLSPLIGVGAVVFDAQGRVLLVQRGSEPGKGRWSIPGGLVELGETLESAVVREVAEETGIVVEVAGRIEIVERVVLEETNKADDSARADQSAISSQAGAPRVRYHYILVDYLCRAVSGELRAASDAVEAVWAERETWAGTSSTPLELDKDLRWMIEKGWQMTHV